MLEHSAISCDIIKLDRQIKASSTASAGTRQPGLKSDASVYIYLELSSPFLPL